MKKILMGAAAALAISAPSLAHADTDAIVGLQYTTSDYGSGDDLNNYGLNGGFNNDMGNGWNLQLDGQIGRLDAGNCCYAMSYGAVHLGMRSDTHQFGGFVGLTDFVGYSGLDVGLEGTWFLGNFNLGASAAYADFDDADMSVSSLELDGAYFFTPNLALTGVVATNNLDAGGMGGDTDYTTLGVGGEWRFSNSPASIQLGYRNADFDGGDVDSWTIGFKWDMGSDTVQDRTRSGVSFDGASNFFRTLIAG
jgi:hypothetical protein